MNDMFALAASITIGTLFLLSIMRFQFGVSEHSLEKTAEMLTQQSTATLMQIIEDDFQKIGSGVPISLPPIESRPDSTDITFYADLDGDGEPETVRYYLDTAADVAATDNPDDHILYRVVNGTTTLSAPAGVTAFAVYLRDFESGITTDFAEAAIVEVAVEVQSNIPYTSGNPDTTIYPTTVWRKWISPPNMVHKISESL